MGRRRLSDLTMCVREDAIKNSSGAGAEPAENFQVNGATECIQLQAQFKMVGGLYGDLELMLQTALLLNKLQ